MKSKKFNLKEKEMICCENMNGMFVYPSKHVKEAVKRLKGLSTKNEFGNDAVLIKQINEIFGDDLI